MVHHDPDAMGLLFDWSMMDFLAKFFTNKKLIDAYVAQGIEEASFEYPTGGKEAIDAALKIAKKVHRKRRQRCEKDAGWKRRISCYAATRRISSRNPRACGRSWN